MAIQHVHIQNTQAGKQRFVLGFLLQGLQGSNMALSLRFVEYRQVLTGVNSNCYYDPRIHDNYAHPAGLAQDFVTIGI